jgi:hypothetical protein
MTRKTYTYWEKFWLTGCSYNPTHKGSWHHEARTRMRRLAKELGLERGTYDIRSNMAGIAVSGEVTLHGEDIYVQVSQSSGGPRMGILFRPCDGRKDYTGGINHFSSIHMLEDIQNLAASINNVLKREGWHLQGWEDAA